MGFHAQLAAIASNRIVPKPSGIGHDEAAAVLFGGTTALHFLRDRVRPGARVLVNGASGAVGTSAVQLAALDGARVTAVTSAANAPLARRLGADATFDYRSRSLEDLPQHRFDLVFDAVGNIDRRIGLRLATPEGRVALAVADLWNTIRARGRVIASPSQESPGDMARLLALVAEGRLDPVARTLGGLETIVEAYRMIDSGRKVGNIVVRPWA
nr:NAD(P)-dependent alcohol dehydrogenase [Leucobacter edaphi]